MANGSSKLRLRELELRRHKLRNPRVEKAQIHSGSDHTITRAMVGWDLPTAGSQGWDVGQVTTSAPADLERL